MVDEKKHVENLVTYLDVLLKMTSDKDIPSEMLEQIKELVDVIKYMVTSESWKAGYEVFIYDAMEVQNRLAKILEKENIKVS